MKFWFHNNTRGSSSGSGTRGILKLSTAAKLVQPWQAYLNKFQHTKLKKKIEDAWRDYRKGVPNGEKPEKTLFEIRNKVARELYEEESTEVKREVENHRRIMRESQVASDAEKNASFQK